MGTSAAGWLTLGQEEHVGDDLRQALQLIGYASVTEEIRWATPQRRTFPVSALGSRARHAAGIQ